LSLVIVALPFWLEGWASAVWTLIKLLYHVVTVILRRLHLPFSLELTEVFFWSSQPLAWVDHFLLQWGHHKFVQIQAQY
jgi:hypothetical protein